MNRTRRWTQPWLGAIALATLVGCQGPAAVGPLASLNLGAVGPDATGSAVTEPPPAQPVVVAELAAPTAPVAPTAAPTAEPLARSGGRSRSRQPAPLAPTGSLTVDLAPVLESLQPAAQRRILATVNDIDRLIVTIRMPGQPDRVTEVSRAELDAGTTSLPFTGLPTGTCTVVIEAKAADGTVIGTSSRVAPIAESQVTAVAVRVMIVPADGQYYSYTNSLIFGVDLAAAPAEQAPDGSGPVSGTVVASYPIWTIASNNFLGMPGLYADGAGHFYTRFVMMSNQQSFSAVNRYSTTDGSAQGSLMLMAGVLRSPVTPIVYDPVHSVLVAGSHIEPSLVPRDVAPTSIKVLAGAYNSRALAVDAAGDALYLKNGLIQRENATGVTATTIPAFTTFCLDTAGQFWVNAADTVGSLSTLRKEVLRYSADGTLLATYPLPFMATRLVSDGEGGMWVADRPGGQLLRIQADGTVGAPIGVAANDFCVDAARNLWVATTTSLLKLAPDGLQLGDYPIKAKSIAFGDGYVFAGVDGAQAVLKITP